ncbi:hypothetical protein E4U26_008115 [Claviceps purpurea]|nr:hypothetical protein E4U26_008115 [Claviceps purpurea]KAG6251160.1 hypothetical protein E4U49_007841 [Claviceps purpurea]
MATTPALSPEPPTDLCPKLSTKMQIVVPSLKPSQVLQQSLKKKQEAIVRTPSRDACVIRVSRQGENSLLVDQNNQPDQPFRNQPSNAQSFNRSKNHQHFETLRGRPEAKRL